MSKGNTAIGNIHVCKSSEVKAGDIAVVVNPEVADLMDQFVAESKKNGIVAKITLGHLIQVAARANKMTGGPKHE